MVPTFLVLVSVRSSSGTRSMPRCSTPKRPAIRCNLWYKVSPVTNDSPYTAPDSSGGMTLRCLSSLPYSTSYTGFSYEAIGADMGYEEHSLQKAGNESQIGVLMRQRFASMMAGDARMKEVQLHIGSLYRQTPTLSEWRGPSK